LPKDRDGILLSLPVVSTLFKSALSHFLQVYQTYFLDANDKKELWTDDLISPSKILKTKWLRAFSHTWSHFAKWVVWGRFIQGTKNTLYCGSWVLFNTQEIAMMSGIAAAERLGADYPFSDDPLAVKQFEMFYKIVHGRTRRRVVEHPKSS
jgi:hypothetical protein